MVNLIKKGITMKPLTLHHVLADNVTRPDTLPSLFISHGAPTIALEDTPFTQALAQLGKTLPTPRVIIVMSAHWESEELVINATPAPSTWHDFGGFSRA